MTKELAELRREDGLVSSESPAECAAGPRKNQIQSFVNKGSNNQGTASLTETTTVQSTGVVKVLFVHFLDFY